MLWAKTAVHAVTTFALCLPATVAAFLVGQSILAAENLDVALDRVGVLRAVVDAALYITVVGLLGLGLGALLRNTAAAVAALGGLLFGLQLVVGLLPSAWADRIYPYLPAPAGVAVTAVRLDPPRSGRGPGAGCSASTSSSCWQSRPGGSSGGTPDLERMRPPLLLGCLDRAVSGWAWSPV